MNQRGRLLAAMDEIMLNLNDEEELEYWITYGVPDGASEDDIQEMADDDVTLKECAELFMRMIKDCKGGLYIDERICVIE